uniref:Putative secreted protein n=1 Tax=Panstrongylus lignarius TaxID=156445 RepID=A0A224Y4U8_9HEMI
MYIILEQLHWELLLSHSLLTLILDHQIFGFIRRNVGGHYLVGRINIINIVSHLLIKKMELMYKLITVPGP